MVKKAIKRVDNASKAAELAMEFVKKMVPPMKAESARLISAKREDSFWEVKIDVGLIYTEEVLLRINVKGEIEEYLTRGPFEPKQR